MIARDWGVDPDNLSPLEEACYGDTDKGHHGYLPLYEKHLCRDDIATLTEIGVYSGGSLRMWRRWLPQARVIGIDIEPFNYIPQPEDPLEEFIAGDATTMRPDWTSDVIIDDGSHHGDDQAEVFMRFWPTLEPGGWYVIEDLSTVWGSTFRAGWMVWGLLTHLLAESLREKHSVAQVHGYEQILFVQKR